MTRLVIGYAARRELRAAAEWYEDRERGLGEEFVLEVDRTLQAIASTPERNPLWRPQLPFHKALVDRFPYVVLL